MQDRNPAKGDKKEPVKATSSFKKIPTKVYHVIKPKGNTAMIELKITAETASELTSEIQELAQQVVGTHLCDCQDGKLVEAPVVEAKPKEEKPKNSRKASKPVEEKVEAPAEPEVKEAATKAKAPKVEEAPKAETPKEEAPKEETKVYKIDKVRSAVKDFVQADPDNKAKIAAFLHNDLGVKSISEAPTRAYNRILEFVGAAK